MAFDIAEADAPIGAAVLLHPHPDYGGDRFHPLIDRLHRTLPDKGGVTSLRFDFVSAEPERARDQIVEAIGTAAGENADLRVVLAGYSFGAGMAATVIDPRVAGWYLVGVPAGMLRTAPIGDDPRPKHLAVPAHDQFGPPGAVREATLGWESATVEVIDGTDHFLAGAIDRIADGAAGWMSEVLRTS